MQFEASQCYSFSELHKTPQPIRSHPHKRVCSTEIGATEGFKCQEIKENFNARKFDERVDQQRTCDDTAPTWEALEYSNRFVTKKCKDTLVNDGDTKV